MKVAQTLLLALLFIATATATANTNNLRHGQRRTEGTSPVCSAAQLTTFACNLPYGVTGAYVCRYGFSVCIAPDNHHATDACGICPVQVLTTPPAVEVPRVLPTCSQVDDLGDFACSLAEGETGVLTCQGGFTACIATDSVDDNDRCGCCPNDNSPRCQ